MYDYTIVENHHRLPTTTTAAAQCSQLLTPSCPRLLEECETVNGLYHAPTYAYHHNDLQDQI